MTNQAQVREIYLRILDATIESVREEFSERAAAEPVFESLDLLKSRWSARLTQTHDFSDDPALVDRPAASTARGGKKPKSKKKGAVPVTATAPTPAAPKPPPAALPTRNGVIPVAALTNATDEAVQPLPTIPRVAAKLQPDDEVQEVRVQPPPAKRARTDAVVAPSAPPAKKEEDDGCFGNEGEDLDSSDDSDVADNDSDEQAENMVLAQHDKVRKGQKWKIILREGIISIRGRDYLFNKATCDLDLWN